MTTEFDVLRRVSQGLESLGIPYMLTGSFAMAHYATPRMTRDIDLVVALASSAADLLFREFSTDFYVDADAVRAAIAADRFFNLMHFASAIKIDLIVRKNTPFRLGELDRRRRVTMNTVETWIVSREDLILSKLVWASDGRSELQLRDVERLLDGPIDVGYLYHWARELRVLESLQRLRP